MIQLTDVAKAEVKKLIDQQDKPQAFLRVGVKGGGCSGLSYEVNFDDKINEFDRIYDMEGIKVVCNSKSFIYLDGLVIDFSKELVGGGFRFINPNATGTCGCGTSFSA